MAIQLHCPVIVASRKHNDPLFQGGASNVYYVRVGYQQLVLTAATTHNIDILNWPAFVEVEGAFINHIQDFAGGTISAMTVSVGRTGSVADYVAATNCFTGAGAGFIVGKTIVPGNGFPSVTPGANGTVRIQFLSTTANMTALTAGKLEVALKVRAYPFRTA